MWSCEEKLNALYRSQSALRAFEQRRIDTFPLYTEVHKVYNVTDDEPLQFKKNNFFYKKLKINKWLRVPLDQLLVETNSFNCDYYMDLTNLVEKQFLNADLGNGKNVMFIENLDFLPSNPQCVDPEDGSVMLIRIGKSVYNFYKNVSRRLDLEFLGESIQVFEDVCDTNYTFFTLNENNYKELIEKKQECFISNGFAYIQTNVHKPKKNDIIFRNGVFRSETTNGNILFTETFIEPGKSAKTFYIKAFNVMSSQASLQVSQDDRYFIKVENNDSYLGFKNDSLIKLTKNDENILWKSIIGSATVYYFKYSNIENGKNFYIICYITVKKRRDENDIENFDDEIAKLLAIFRENHRLKPTDTHLGYFLVNNVGMDNDSVTEIVNLSVQYHRMSEESHTRRGHFYSKYMLYMEMDKNYCAYDPIIIEEEEEDTKRIEEKEKGKKEPLSLEKEEDTSTSPATDKKQEVKVERGRVEPRALFKVK